MEARGRGRNPEERDAISDETKSAENGCHFFSREKLSHDAKVRACMLGRIPRRVSHPISCIGVTKARPKVLVLTSHVPLVPNIERPIPPWRPCRECAYPCTHFTHVREGRRAPPLPRRRPPPAGGTAGTLSQLSKSASFAVNRREKCARKRESLSKVPKSRFVALKSGV